MSEEPRLSLEQIEAIVLNGPTVMCCGVGPRLKRKIIQHVREKIGSATQPLSEASPVNAQERSAIEDSLELQVSQLQDSVATLTARLAQYQAQETQTEAYRQRALTAESTVSQLQEENQRLREERDSFKRNFDAELDGNAAIRRMFGARDEETFFAFIQRLASAEALAAERQQEIEKLMAEGDRLTAEVERLQMEARS